MMALFGVKRTAHQHRAKRRHNRYRQQGRTDHGEGLGERQRMKQLPLLPGQGEDRHEREDDDGHGKEDGAPDLPGGFDGDPERFRGGEPRFLP